MDFRETALSTLDEMLNYAEHARVHDPALWWPSVTGHLAALEVHPLTRELLRLVPPVDPKTALYGPGNASTALDEWGRQAYAFLRAFRPGREAELEPLRNQPGHDFSRNDVFRATAERAVETNIARANGLYLRPLVAWLRAEILAGQHVETLIERWIQRCEHFGIEGLGDVAGEAALQASLHRYLFDAGLDPAEDYDREVPVGRRGRVDFLLRRDDPVPVELKLWRDGSKPAVAAWTYQAREYASGLRVRRAYLVIANGSDAERLAPEAPLGNREPVHVAGVELYVRFLDLRKRAPSKEARTPRRVTISDVIDEERA